MQSGREDETLPTQKAKALKSHVAATLRGEWDGFCVFKSPGSQSCLFGSVLT